MTGSDERLMLRAVANAAEVRGTTAPNPWVGAVLVTSAGAIHDGATQPPGGPHAERVALAAAVDAGDDPSGSTLYTTLEPCSHTGRTGPCADALVDAEVARVVVGIVAERLEAQAVLATTDADVDGRGAPAEGARRQTGVLQRFPAELEEEPLLGVECLGFASGDAEESRVKAFEFVEQSGATSVGMTGRSGLGIVDRIDVEALDRTDSMSTFREDLPQASRRVRAPRHAASQPDDGNWLRALVHGRRLTESVG